MRTLIVVPCYNEASRLDARAFETYLSSSGDVGFVLVNDGSTDRTLEVLRDMAGRWPGRVHVIDQQPNAGKAEAVRVGMLHAFGTGVAYSGYFDADLATPLDSIDEFIATLDRHAGIDVVIGSRLLLLGRAIKRSAKRHYLGRVFATAASVVLDLPVYDTQCGAKLFRSTDLIRGLFARPFGSRWIFDVEIFARYLNDQGRREALYELPLLRWEDIGGSRVKGIDFVRAIAEMAGIYRTYRLPRDSRFVIRLATSPALRYATVGAIGTLAHYITLTILVEALHQPVMRATTIGAIVGAIVNYALNYHFTFASQASHARTFPRFLAVATVSAGLNYCGMWVAVELFKIHYMIAQLACTFGVLVFGYLLNKLWTFAIQPTPAVRTSVDNAAAFVDALPASAVGSAPAEVQSSTAWDNP